MSDLSFDKVAQAYMENNRKLGDMEAAHELATKPLRDAKAAMKKWFMAKLAEGSLQNVKTSVATVFKKETMNVKVTSRFDLAEFCTNHELDFFKEEPDVKAIKEYLEAGASRGVPPGVDVSYFVDVGIRSV